MAQDIPYWVASIGAEVKLRSEAVLTDHSVRVKELLEEIDARETTLRLPSGEKRALRR